MANTKITSRVIADNAILTANITNDAVTSAKLDTNIAIAGTLGVTGIVTLSDDLIIGNGKTIGSASDTDAITIASNGQLTLTQTLIGTGLDISGNIDVDGTTNLDVVDIDGAVDMATTLAVAGTATFAGLVDAAIIDGANFKVNGGQGSDGQVLTSTGSGVAWEAAAGTTINNNANNRIITGSGTANTLEGEASLTYDGLHLGMTSNNAGHPSDANVLQLGGNAVIQGKTATGAGKSFRIMQNVYDDASAGLSYISTDEASHYTQVNGTHSFNVAASGSAGAAITFKEAVNIRADGNVGIGVAATTVPLTVQVASDINWRFLTASSEARMMAISDNGGTYKSMSFLGHRTRFYQQGTLALEIKENRHIYMVNATGEVVSGSEFVTLVTGGHGMAIKTSAVPMFCWTTAVTTYGAQTLIGFYHISTSVGAITTNNNATQYTTASDYRLKENVDYTWDATTRLKQLKPARFNWINDDDNTLVDGFLAHEVQSVVPQAVAGNKDAVYSAEEAEDMVAVNTGDIKPQSIDESKLVPLLVKTIQELEARITALES